MTPLPKKKHSRSRSNQRRSASFSAKLPTLAKCPSCKKFKEPHKACPHCGFYKA